MSQIKILHPYRDWKITIMAITKNRQPEEILKQMVRSAFPDKLTEKITELTEGMCNAAYFIEFTDGSRSVVKIAAENNDGLMSNEVNMMDAEVKAMRIVNENAVRAARVQYYDTSRTVCSGNYFFMEALPGESFFSIRDKLSEEEKSVINYETGQISKRLTLIQNDYFGLLGDAGHQFRKLYDFSRYLISNILQDAKKKDIVIGVSPDEILRQLSADKGIFEEVTQPSLVHYDMWDGNIFVEGKHIGGIIDWERAMWGEALMDDRFRRHTRNNDFLRGFGKEEFTKEEMQRIYWYDALLYLVMMTEGSYRGYEDDSQYKWAKEMFLASWEDICKGGRDEKAVL